MWPIVLVPFAMIFYDYFKAPIDSLYFTKPQRLILGIQNTFRDVIYFHDKHEVKDYPGLLLIKLHYKRIQEEYEKISTTLEKKYYHDVDAWFEKNDNYYFYKVENFPILDGLIKQIPCIDTRVAAFAVTEGPMVIPPHRAESNELLRYHITIQGDGDCTLYTQNGEHVHIEGEDFLFDHSRYHELIKTGNGKRVVLILDVNRF